MTNAPLAPVEYDFFTIKFVASFSVPGVVWLQQHSQRRLFCEATPAALLVRSGIEADLKLAMVRNQLETHYQISVDQARQVTGIEVLLRCAALAPCHAVRGWVLRDEFISIANQSGLTLHIGQWVLQTSCELLATWARLPARCGWSMAVNVSTRQVGQADFVDMVRRFIVQSGCNPALLKLKLT